jgi:bifunctional ADP-heptose synthase (sugar kinase/adenylyltransferase)
MAEVRTVGTSGADSRSESIADLIKQLRDEALALVRQEVTLAKTEISEKLSRSLRNTSYALAGALVAFLGLVFILQAVTVLTGIGLKAAGLSDEQCLWLAPLIVGVVVAVIGTTLVTKGIATLKHESLVPQQTIDSLKTDKAWIQNKTN